MKPWLCDDLPFIIFSFSDIFYIDATSENRLEMDLQAIAPRNAEQSVDASLDWLANQRDGSWLLFFDNTDGVHLALKKFFPSYTSGNILVTTRNQELRHYTTKGCDHHFTDMDHEDVTNLLMDLSHAEETDENKILAAQIVKVFSIILVHEMLRETRTWLRSCIILLWQFRKLAPSFIVTHH
jgi:hypothetical protein